MDNTATDIKVAQTTDHEPDPNWRDRPASLESRLERIADGQDRLIAQLSVALRPGGSAAVGFTESNRLDSVPSKGLAGTVAERLPDEVTVEAVWDKARQLHALVQDLGMAFGSMIYGPGPASQPLEAPPSPADRLQATWEALCQCQDAINRLADTMRRRA